MYVWEREAQRCTGIKWGRQRLPMVLLRRLVDTTHHRGRAPFLVPGLS